MTLIVVAAGCFATRDPFGSDYRLKAPFIAALHRGMTRHELYAAARRLSVVPDNPEYVRWGKDRNGPPIDNGDFPEPNALHPHPMVRVVFHKPPAGCAIPTDEVDVYFDGRDRVARWTSTSFITGGCP